MSTAPLLLGLPRDPIMLGLDVVAGLLGLAVGYVGLRGYRRNASLPMLFVATGFLVAFVVPVVLVGAAVAVQAGASLSATLQRAVPWAVRTAGRVCEVVGLALILYGLAMPLRR